MSEKLKPCPFCGSESCVARTGGGGCAWVECPQCKADGPEHLQGVEAAVAAWNAAPRMWPRPLTPAERAVLDAAEKFGGAKTPGYAAIVERDLYAASITLARERRGGGDAG